MKRDFFISRAGADKDVAAVIDHIIKRAGYTTWIQEMDFGHASFMARMAQGFSGSERMIALLSATYQQSDYCKKEYEYILTGDPRNLKERLIVFRIDESKPVEHLRDLAYVDLVPVLNNAEMLERLIRVAIGVDTRQSELDFASLYRRAPAKILHPSIKEIPDLVKREDELDALDKLMRGSDTTRTAAVTDVASVLHGLGGVGKSILARQYAWHHRNTFAGVWWVRADTRQNILDDLFALGTRLIPGIADSTDQERAVQTVLDEIAAQWSINHGPSSPWLLVYDNVESPKEIENLTPHQGAAVLVTSRWTDWHGYAKELPLGMFTPETATKYLLEHSRNQTKESAECLATALGHLPLAIDQARAYCWRAHCSFDDYRQRLSTLIQKAPKDAHYPQSVFATYNLALEQAKAVEPGSQQLIGMLAFFAADSVPRSLISKQLREQCDEAISALANYSLISFDNLEDGTSAISCHRLVQQVAHSRLGDKKEETIENCLDALIAQWPGGNDGSNPKFWPICRSLLPHAEALLQHVDEERDYAEKIALLLNNIAHYLASTGSYQTAEHLNRKGLEIRQRVLGEEHSDTASSYNNVASNLDEQGRYEEAEPLYRKGLEIFQRVQGEMHSDTATSYNNVASNLDEQRRFEEAEPLYRKGLEIRQRVLGEEHPDTASSYNNVASNLDEQGRYEEAEPLYRKSLEIRQQVLGEEHPDTASSYNNVASNLDDQGRYGEAEPLYRLSYDTLSKSLGEQHPKTKVVWENWHLVKSKTDD